MTYETESISDEEWKRIRECSEVLRGTSARPAGCAIERADGSFLVEIGNTDSRGELFRRCIYVTATRSLLVTVSDPTVRTYVISWKAWDGISEQELDALNVKLTQAVSALYPFTSSNLSVQVENNPYHEIPSQQLFELINSQINFWYGHKRLQVMQKQTEKLMRGKQSFLKWRFYLAKWRGLPKYESVNPALVDMVSAYFIHPKHKAMLMAHLDEGGEGFSDDTKRVLVYIRNQYNCGV